MIMIVLCFGLLDSILCPYFGKTEGMLGSILGGSHACKSLDVVLKQQKGEQTRNEMCLK